MQNTTEEILQGFKQKGIIDDYNIQTNDTFGVDQITIKTILTTFKDRVPSVSTGYATGRLTEATHVSDESLANALKRHSLYNQI